MANLQKEIGTQAYILDRLFGPNFPLVTAFTTKITPFIDNNSTPFERQVITAQSCTTFAYDLSRAETEYNRACIQASTTATMDDPRLITPVSFQLLVDELRWGCYRGQQLLASLQLLLLPSNRSPSLVSKLNKTWAQVQVQMETVVTRSATLLATAQVDEVVAVIEGKDHQSRIHALSNAFASEKVKVSEGFLSLLRINGTGFSKC